MVKTKGLFSIYFGVLLSLTFLIGTRNPIIPAGYKTHVELGFLVVILLISSGIVRFLSTVLNQTLSFWFLAVSTLCVVASSFALLVGDIHERVGTVPGIVGMICIVVFSLLSWKENAQTSEWKT